MTYKKKLSVSVSDLCFTQPFITVSCLRSVGKILLLLFILPLLAACVADVKEPADDRVKPFINRDISDSNEVGDTSGLDSDTMTNVIDTGTGTVATDTGTASNAVDTATAIGDTDTTTTVDVSDTATATEATDTTTSVDSTSDTATETASTDTTDSADTGTVSTDTSDTANVDDAFVTTWNTEVEFYNQSWINSQYVWYESGPFPFPEQNQIDLPLIEEGHYNFSVDWGDGTSDIITSWNASARRHTYASAGIYDVSIRGEISGWSFKRNEYEVSFPHEDWNTRARVVQTPRLIEIKRFGPLTIGYTGEQFYGCENLTVSATDSPQFLENADLSNAFNGCTFSDTVEMNHWQTARIVNMSGMFAGASNFNSPLDSWNTHHVTDMSLMFSGASAFNQDVSAWHIGNATNMSGMFGGVTLETDIYDNILNLWSQQTVQPGIDISFGYSKYTSFAARQKLIEEDGWRITDGGIGAEPGTGTIPAIPQTEPFISSWSLGLPNQGVSIKLPLVENGEYLFEVDWGDGSRDVITSWNDPNATHYMPGKPDNTTDDTTLVTITGKISGWQMDCGGLPMDCCTYDENIWFGEPWSGEWGTAYVFCCFDGGHGCCNNVRTRPSHLVEISQWGSLALGPTEKQFANCDGMKITATDAPDLSQTTSLHGIFEECDEVDGLATLNQWDVSSITDMSRMFVLAGCNPYDPYDI